MRRRKFTEVLVHQWPVKALSIAAAVLLFLFNKMSLLQEKYLAVPLAVVCAQGYVPASSHDATVRVRLKGEPSRISTVAAQDLRAFVDLRDRTAEGAYAAPVQVEWAAAGAGSEPLELSAEPGEIRVRIERELVKLVLVVPTYSGLAESGYAPGLATVTPERLEVDGPRSAVERIAELRTEAIDLTGRTSDFSIKVRARADSDLVTVRGGGEVTFSMKMETVDLSKEIAGLPIEIRNLAPSLVAQAEPGTGRLKAAGSAQGLAGLDKAAVALYVDCGDVTKPGSYRLAVKAALPAPLAAKDISPAELVLSFAEAPTGRTQQ